MPPSQLAHWMIRAPLRMLAGSAACRAIAVNAGARLGAGRGEAAGGTMPGADRTGAEGESADGDNADGDGAGENDGGAAAGGCGGRRSGMTSGGTNVVVAATAAISTVQPARRARVRRSTAAAPRRA